MKLSQKKNCEACRAAGGVHASCELGFDNLGPYDGVLKTYLIRPQEPCYKPRTITELYEAQRLIQITRLAEKRLSKNK